jgi:flagellar motor switch protein FliG
LATVSTILNSADEAARRQILSNLARHDRPLAGKLKRPTAALPRFTFDDVCGLPIDDLMLVVQSAPLETFVLAFAGANAELVEELVDCLPAEASQRFARGIAELGPTRLADIESAQHSLAELASQLSADGRLHGGPPIHLTAVA